MNPESLSSSERRSFLSRLNTGIVSFAAMAGIAMAQQTETPTPAAPWAPARHPKDDWLDKANAKHRVVFDTISMDGVTNAAAFVENFYRVNQTEYGIENADLAVVFVVRHAAAVFGFNNAIWAKYGATLAARAKITDPKNPDAPPPTANRYLAAPTTGDAPARGGAQFEAIAKQGGIFGVCALSTRALAGGIARAAGKTQDEVFTEMSNNLVPNGRLVPAGVVAVTRAQERGYSLVSC